MKIALDVMGGDNSPISNIIGGKLFLESNIDPNTKIIFVGNESLIKEKIKENNIQLDYKRIEFENANDIVKMDESKPTSIFKSKPDSSIVKSIQLVKNKKADAIISAGNTAALLSSSLFILGKIEGIKRPALSTYIPTMESGFVLCDVGANTDVKPIHLLQFSIMASAYIKYIKSIDSPKIALLNIGSERNKGNQLTTKAFDLLENNMDGFIGNLEPRYIFDGKAEVVICDGFTGNVIIKLMEGIVSHTYNWLTLNNQIKTSDKTMKSINQIFNHYNYEEHGGSPFLGVKGIVLKSHGSSSEISIKNTLITAELFFKNNLMDRIEENLSNNKSLFSSLDITQSR